MANAVSIFDPNQVPAHVKAAQAAGQTNIITQTAQVNALTFPGKVWYVTVNGAKKPLMRTNQDGEEETAPIVDVVVIAFNENLGRAYYGDGAFDPNQRKAPLCWSNDGITSDPNGSARQSEKCNVCPKAIKGSSQTDQGKAAVACRKHRNLAVIPRSKNLATAPILKMQIPQTSNWDGQSKDAEAKGMFAFQNYLNYLHGKAPFTYSVFTRMRFDQNANYPKIFFSASGWLTQEQSDTIEDRIKSTDLDALLRTDFSGFNTPVRPPGITEEDEDDDGLTEEETVVAQAPAAAATAKPAPVPPVVAPTLHASVGHTNGAAGAPVAAPAKAKAGAGAAAKKVAAAEAAAAARKAATLVEDGDDDEVVPTTAAPAVTKPAKPAAPTAEIDDILADFDD